MANRILVVDDEKGIAETLAIILRMKGYEAHTAFDGLEGYEAACRLKPSLIISDIVMPKLNGIEMAIRIKEKLEDAKFLLLSGQAVTVELLQEATARGHVFDCLAKPVHPTDLLARVDALLTQPVQ